MATIVFGAIAGNWNDDTKWVGGVKPTAADDAQLVLASANCTLDAAAVCRSLDCNTYTGTLLHNPSVTLSIGDGTAGASNIALRLVSGMNYSTDSFTELIKFVSTSTTQQTITTGGEISGAMEFDGVGGSWILSDACSVTSGGSSSSITLTNGTLNTNGQTVTTGAFNSTNSNTRVLTLGASSINLNSTSNSSLNFLTTTNFTLNADTSTITLSGSGGGINSGGVTLNNVIFSGAGTQRISGVNTFANLTRTGTAVKTDGFRMDANQVITGTLTINGNSSINRMYVVSDTIGTPRTLTAATVSVTNADFRDITGAGAGSWDLSAITGLSGDAGGNSGITFTTAAAQTNTGATGNWSDVTKWTSRVPLPQDDCTINTGTGTITQDMPRAGKNIDFTGFTGTWTTSTTASIFGSLTLVSGMTLTASTPAYTFEGRSTYTLTNAGKTWWKVIILNAPGGTLTLQDAFTSGATQQIQFINGTFDANDFNVTTGSTSASGGVAKTIVMGSGVWELTTTAGSNAWEATAATTITPETSTIKISGSTTNTRIFDGGGKTYYNLWFSNATAAGALRFIGSNTFNDIKAGIEGNAQTLAFQASTTTTVTTFTVSGAPSNLITIGSITAASHALVKAGGGIISCDYLSISRSDASPASTWYAGANSTDGLNNTGWLFEAAPAIWAIAFIE